MKFSLPDCATAKDYAKRIRPMPLSLLRQMKADREAAVVELHAIEREIVRRRPSKTVYFRIEMGEQNCPGVCFETVDSPTRRHPDGQRHRIHPRKPEKQTQYPQDLCADEINAWMSREGITHVVSESEDTETTPESLAAGRYTRGQFIKWWRLLEEDD